MCRIVGGLDVGITVSGRPRPQNANLPSREVRSFEQLKFLPLGLLAELPRKTLPAIARVVGEDEQPLHHFLANSPWEVATLREKRLQVVKQVVGDRPLILCIDETGDKKKGQTTDDVARQYIGNLGKIEKGLCR